MLQCFVLVQNGSLHQKDTVHDNDFEPYLSGQSNQVSVSFVNLPLFLRYRLGIVRYMANTTMTLLCS